MGDDIMVGSKYRNILKPNLYAKVKDIDWQRKRIAVTIDGNREWIDMDEFKAEWRKGVV